MAACCDIDVLLEVIPYGLLTIQAQLLEDVFPPMIDSPQIKRYVLSQVTDCPRVSVKAILSGLVIHALII